MTGCFYHHIIGNTENWSYELTDAGFLFRLYKGEDGKLVETGRTGFAMVKSPAGTFECPSSL